MKNKVEFLIRLEVKDREKLRQLAFKLDTSMAKIIRQSISEYLEKHNAEAILPKCAG